MKMKTARWSVNNLRTKSLGLVLAAVFLLAVAIGMVWFWEGENFSDGAVSGTYTFNVNGESTILVLGLDHTFRQEQKKDRKVTHAEGKWHVFGEGGIGFSQEFLRVSGQEAASTSQVNGQIKNWFGLVSITLAPNPDGPTFRKNVLR
jgi:hypothetical protein